MLKIINLTTGISAKWLETGEGEMLQRETPLEVEQDADQEIEEIINLYRQLNPFFKSYFKRQLQDIVNYELGAWKS